MLLVLVLLDIVLYNINDYDYFYLFSYTDFLYEICYKDNIDDVRNCNYLLLIVIYVTLFYLYFV